MALRIRKNKKRKEKQQELGLKIGVDTKVSGFLYRFQKIERLLEVSPFWRSSFVWFIISFDIFAHVILFFYLYDKIGDLPPRVPFLYIYPQGEKQLIEPFSLWYFYGVSAFFSILNLIFAGRLYAAHRNEAKYLLCAELVKTVLFLGLIYKTFVNWI